MSPKDVFKKFLAFCWTWIKIFVLYFLLGSVFYMFKDPRCFYGVISCETSLFSTYDVIFLILSAIFALFHLKYKKPFIEKILHFGIIFFLVFLLISIIIALTKDFSSFSFSLLIGTNFLLLFISFLVSYLCFRFEREIVFVLKPLLKFVGILIASCLIVAFPLTLLNGILSFLMPGFVDFYWKNLPLFGFFVLLMMAALTFLYYKNKKVKRFFIFLSSISAVCLFLIISIRIFVLTPLIFHGTEMEPYLKDGQYILVQKLDKTPKRGDIMAFLSSSDNRNILLGIVVGLPGEEIIVENGILYINGKKLEEIKYSLNNCYFNESFTIPSDFFLSIATNIYCSFPQSSLKNNLHKNSEIVGKVLQISKKISSINQNNNSQEFREFEEKIITDFTKSQDNFFHLLNFKNAKDPTFEQLIDFLKTDDTDNYNYEINKFMCGEFAELLHNNAEKRGIKAGLVVIEFSNTTTIHALNIFNTTDKGFVYVDVTGKNFTEIRKPYLEQKCNYDKIAYIQEGKIAGLISIDVSNIEPEYDFYEKFSSNYKDFLSRLEKYEKRVSNYEEKVNLHNNEVDKYNERAQKYTSEVENYEKERKAYEERVKNFNEKVEEYTKKGIGDYNQLQIEENELNQLRTKLDEWFEKLNTEKISLDKEKTILDERKNRLDNEKQLLDIERQNLIKEEKKFGTCIWEPFPFGEVIKIHVYW